MAGYVVKFLGKNKYMVKWDALFGTSSYNVINGADNIVNGADNIVHST